MVGHKRSIVRHMLVGFQFIDSRELIHRDLKPSHLWVMNCDFTA
jgi:serine/threonine protein kinase